MELWWGETSDVAPRPHVPNKTHETRQTEALEKIAEALARIAEKLPA